MQARGRDVGYLDADLSYLLARTGDVVAALEIAENSPLPAALFAVIYALAGQVERTAARLPLRVSPTGVGKNRRPPGFINARSSRRKPTGSSTDDLDECE